MSILWRVRALTISEGGILPDGRLNLSDAQLIHRNFIGGQWIEKGSKGQFALPCPLSGSFNGVVPRSGDVEIDRALKAFIEVTGGRDSGTRSLFSINDWAQVFRKAGDILERDRVAMRALMVTQFPVSDVEADGEINLMIYLLREGLSAGMLREVFSGRTTPGTRLHEFEWSRHMPLGIVGQVSPWNFALEIVGAQLVCALACSNVMLVKQSERAPGPIEAFIEILLEAGAPPEFIALVHGIGREFTTLGRDKRIVRGVFTGSSATYDRHFGRQWAGEVSGVNGKLFDPLEDFRAADRDSIRLKQVELTRNDMHARSKQKCSGTSHVGLHVSWADAGFLGDLKKANDGRTLANRGLSPVLTHSTAALRKRVADLTALEGAMLIYGGVELPNTYLQPEGELADLFNYGFFAPTLIKLPISVLSDPAAHELLAQECFGPITVVYVWETDEERDMFLRFLASLPERLTFGYVSENQHRVMGAMDIVACGTCYWGAYARTTGSPVWFDFGPATGMPGDGLIAGPPASIATMWTRRSGLQYQPMTHGLAS